LRKNVGTKLDESGNWVEGIYFLPEFQKAALVAINQLPVTEDTLWLRVLGKRGTQQQAIDELLALPKENPLRRNILEILANWRINVNESENLSEEDRELLMNLSPAYQRWQEETLQKGRQEGRQEGRLEERQQMVENVLKARFGSLDEELSGAIAPMLQLPPEELTRLLLNLSREELLERFGGQSN
jgi:flagellar biosynthesis/type III secretory pathway protein FliH